VGGKAEEEWGKAKAECLCREERGKERVSGRGESAGERREDSRGGEEGGGVVARVRVGNKIGGEGGWG